VARFENRRASIIAPSTLLADWLETCDPRSGYPLVTTTRWLPGIETPHTLINLTVSAAEIRLIGGRMVPLAQIDGRWHVIDTKPSLLTLGVAVAIPVDDEGRDDWETLPRLSVVVPPDVHNGRPSPLEIEDATDHPAVVELARHFVELVVTGEARPGPLRIEDFHRREVGSGPGLASIAGAQPVQ